MDLSAEFEQYRPALLGLAYRMLGSPAQAEDIVQEAYLRSSQDTSEVRSPKSWLAKIVTRLCLDHLRSAQVRREQYVGPWLPEPALVEAPADSVVMAESLSYAFLVVLQSLSPPERAVFLLREVFDHDYSVIAEILGTTEASCRQILTRARKSVEARRPRFPVPPEKQTELLQTFLNAAASGDLEQLTRLLAQDATLYTDGGGKVQTALNPIHGSNSIARYFLGVAQKASPDLRVRFATVNGQPGVVFEEHGRAAFVLHLAVGGDQIREVYLLANPDKLKNLKL